MTPKERAEIANLRSLVAKEVETLKQQRDTDRARLAEVERERYLNEQGLSELKPIAAARTQERDTARAQVETLAEALRRLAKGLGHHQYQCSDIARSALKAAGLTNTLEETK